MLLAFLSSEIWQTEPPKIMQDLHFFCSSETSSKANASFLSRHVSKDSVPSFKGYPTDLEHVLLPALKK